MFRGFAQRDVTQAVIYETACQAMTDGINSDKPLNQRRAIHLLLQQAYKMKGALTVTGQEEGSIWADRRDEVFKSLSNVAIGDVHNLSERTVLSVRVGKNVGLAKARRVYATTTVKRRGLGRNAAVVCPGIYLGIIHRCHPTRCAAKSGRM